VNKLEPWNRCPQEVRASVHAVLTDIDDTLTEEGRLPAIAYHALERLQQAGFLVIPVTGRPAGWCDLIARQWPVDAVVGENGAFYFRYEAKTKRMIRRYAKDDGQRRIARDRLNEIQRAVLAEVPGAAVASDQAYREADLAIDFREDVPPLPRAAVDGIVAIFERFGATAKVSSIHVNGWFGGYDKLSTSQLLFKEAFGRDLEQARQAVVFVVRDSLDAMPAHPRWVTDERSARGFAEVADALIEAKARARQP
jgi:HAD superfamily hydrolase (TIGR01484 family)